MANSELFALRYITTDRTQTSLKSLLKKNTEYHIQLVAENNGGILFFFPTPKVSKPEHPLKKQLLSQLQLCHIFSLLQGFFFFPLHG